MKLDPTIMRTMDRQDFRVLAAVETGMKNHALVPAPLISTIATLRHGGVTKILSSLLRDKLLSHDCSCGYDGYRLTNSGYDILALHNLKSRGFISALGDKIGTGKESDVYLAVSPANKQLVLKFHRLGRTSFRDVKKKRDYFMVNAVSKNRKKGLVAKDQPNSWLFLSRISALKEFSFMKALHSAQYPTPNPFAHNRHIVVMGLVRGIPLYQVHANRISAGQAESIFEQSTRLATRLAQHGLVHCDLNEFNLMVDLSGIQDNISHNDVGDHYVRHSGMSVATRGALSAHGPLQRHCMDGIGEPVTEAPPQATELLETGEAKPVVTLIDFPQMVSTRHPNARELYERDLDCLKRFFVSKLKCVPEEGWNELFPSWDDITSGESSELLLEGDEEESICASLASRAQIRLDEELQASGYSAQDSSRDAELYYFKNFQGQEPSARLAEEERLSLSDHVEEPESEHDEDGSFSLSDHDSVGRVDLTLMDNVASMCTMKDEEGQSIITERSRAVAEHRARERVRQHLEDRKKKTGRQHAFRSRNTNKQYVKGKRVLNDSGF